MSIPERFWRFPTKQVIDSLSKRFDLPNTSIMQDWEYEVADLTRIEEFMEFYDSDESTDDEKFVLMEMMLQSFEDLDEDLNGNESWQILLDLIEENIDIHIYTIDYWSDLDGEIEVCKWRSTSYLRLIFARHQERFI